VKNCDIYLPFVLPPLAYNFVYYGPSTDNVCWKWACSSSTRQT